MMPLPLEQLIMAAQISSDRGIFQAQEAQYLTPGRLFNFIKWECFFCFQVKTTENRSCVCIGEYLTGVTENH